MSRYSSPLSEQILAIGRWVAEFNALIFKNEDNENNVFLWLLSNPQPSHCSTMPLIVYYCNTVKQNFYHINIYPFSITISNNNK